MKTFKQIVRKGLEKFGVINPKEYIGFRKELTPALAEELEIKLLHAFPSHNICRDDFGKIVSLFNTISTKMIGRIGNDVDDYIVNYYMRLVAAKTFSPTDSNFAHVEIGLLFWGGYY